MLVLSRKKGEQIAIGKDITITLVEIRGDKVRIGIEAPKEVPVNRQEVQRKIDRELAEAKGEAEPPTGDQPIGENGRHFRVDAPPGKRRWKFSLLRHPAEVSKLIRTDPDFHPDIGFMTWNSEVDRCVCYEQVIIEPQG